MENSLTLSGRIHNFRKLGRKLLFLDLSQDGHSVQAVVNLSKIGSSEFDSENLEELTRSLRRGHIFSEIQQRQVQNLEPLCCYRYQR